MNGELLTVLDHLERDKGIDREILMTAVESALVSAAKKALGTQSDDVTVKIDRKNGEVKVFSGTKEIKSEDFGRIAAQTAKQIIIQKIREAERDVIFTDYSSRVGNVVNGTVYRFEKGNIIVDLGKTEGFIPKSEQSPKENFRQGDRIKAYVLEVKKTGKGPQIVLSRANPGLVKKLFELEIPEIYEGIVEVKSISREAGDRTKISVFSKDEKIDCVGACVA
ncbi:MAG TPA: transcription termination/antitermination protein NusA [Candidatus Omnitrophota bacterium]|nr:transcription termination/antitermination protein NusA [Candidatus Omnitrophota bacterium]